MLLVNIPKPAVPISHSVPATLIARNAAKTGTPSANSTMSTPMASASASCQSIAQTSCRGAVSHGRDAGHSAARR